MTQKQINAVVGCIAAFLFLALVYVVCECHGLKKLLSQAMENERLRIGNDRLALMPSQQANGVLPAEMPRNPIGFKTGQSAS